MIDYFGLCLLIIIVEFIENALFKSSGEICWSPLPSSLLDELLLDKRDSDGFIFEKTSMHIYN